MTALPPEGWYPDPELGGTAWRWWDGVQWAPQLPMPAYGYGYGPPQTYGVAPAYVAERYRAATTKFGNWLRWAMVANLAWFVLLFVVIAVVFRGNHFDFGSNDAYGEPHFSGSAIGLQLAFVPLSFISYAYLGAFIAWIFQAGKFAEARGWPAARGRTLGAWSLIIPIVQFWWPYEALRDSYPPSARPPLLLKWWVSYLVTPIAALPVYAFAIFGGPVATTISIVVAGCVLAIPVWLGWKVIRDVEAMQLAAMQASSRVG